MNLLNFLDPSQQPATLTAVLAISWLAGVRTLISYLRQHQRIEPRRLPEQRVEEWQNAAARLWYSTRYVRLKRPPDQVNDQTKPEIVDVRERPPKRRTSA